MHYSEERFLALLNNVQRYLETGNAPPVGITRAFVEETKRQTEELIAARMDLLKAKQELQANETNRQLPFC
jgi:hypothetical protein